MLALLKESWNAVQDSLRLAAGDAAHASWLAELRPVLLDRGVVYLEAKSRLVKDRVQRLFRPLLAEVLSREIGTAVQVELQEAPGPLDLELEVSPQQPVIDDGNRTVWLVLKNLIAGQELPSTLFFFHGRQGVGKTLLLRCYREAAGRRTMLFDLPALLRAFQSVHFEKRVDELRAELLAPEPLLLDEAHRIAGKPKLQAFVLAVLQQRQARGDITVLASRWHPKDIRELDPGLCSVMLSGFVARIDPPSPLGRLRYLRALEGAPSRNGRAAAIEGLAQQVNGTYPELRAAWAASRAGAGGRSAVPSRYLALIDPGRVFARVRDRVCERLSVTAQDLLGKSQSRQLSMARKVLAFLCVQEGLSRAEVGRFLCARTRAAVSYMTKSLAADMARSAQVRSIVEGLL